MNKIGPINTGENDTHPLDPMREGFVQQVEKLDESGLDALTDPSIVEALLRAEFSQHIQDVADYKSLKISAESAFSKQVAQARALAQLFTGTGPRAKDYFLQPWNSPEQIGGYIKRTQKLDPTVTGEDAVMMVFLHCFDELNVIIDAGEKQFWEVDAIIEQAMGMLMGTPMAEESEPST